MSKKEYTLFSKQGKSHEGPERSSPYPVNRLSPPIKLVDIAGEIARADEMLASHLSGKLEVIARRIRSLQKEARRIMDKARHDNELHRSRCSFAKIPGSVYYLYRDSNKQPLFSLLSPEDWNGNPPHEYMGAYRLENDMSWTRVDAV